MFNYVVIARIKSKKQILRKIIFKIKEIKCFRKADLYIIGGGGLFPRGNESDYQGKLNKIINARKSGVKKIAIFGVDLCRVEGEASENIWKSICDKVDYVHFRNKFSYDMLTRFCGEKDNIDYSTDLTMGYTNSIEADEEKLNAVFKKLGIRKGEYIIWILAMPWPTSMGENSEFTGRYEKLCGQFIDVIGKYGKGYTNVFLPFYHNSDRKFIADVTPEINVDHIIIEEDNMTLEEKRAVFAGARACVSMRFHGTMFGLAHGVPVAAVSYAPKTTAVMKENGLEKYCTELGIRETTGFFKEFDIDQKELERICRLVIEDNDQEKFQKVSEKLKEETERTDQRMLSLLGNLGER